MRPPANTFLITGNEYFKKGDYESAEKKYREALLSDSNSATALNNLGVILYVQGKYDDAAAVLQRAIDSGPKNATAHYVMSEVLAKKIQV